MKKYINTKQIGNITELECMLSFIRLGYNVLTPYGDCERYDFVVDVNNKFYKIQSKTAYSEDNGKSFIIATKSSNRKNGKSVIRKYTNKEIDYFVTFFNNKCYLIPVEECGVQKKLRIAPTMNGQNNNICWAKNYELEEVIKSL